METESFYQDLLGLRSPWGVESVTYSLSERKVCIRLLYEPGSKFCCPECGVACGLYDHQAERTWRHLDTMQMQTLLVAPVPRVKCPEHGVKAIRLPWAEKESKFTLLFERFAIDVLKECPKSRAAELLGISWKEADTIMRRAVKRGQARKKKQVIAALAVDETSSRKGHNYLTIVTDHERGTVQYVTEGRTTAALEGFYEQLSVRQKRGISAVTMDMWDPYVEATLRHVPEAETKITFDRFHVMRHMNEAVDKTRRVEHRALQAEGDQSLKGTKYLWLRNPETIPVSSKKEFEALRELNLKVGRAWSIKSALTKLWSYTYRGAAERYFRWWYNWATHSRIPAVIKAAWLIKRRLNYILNYCSTKLTNAVAESTNAIIQRIKKKACGFRNIDNFKTAIYFHCGGLDLYPL